MRGLSRQYEQQLAAKDHDIESLQSSVNHLQFQLTLKEEDVENLEKSLKMHEAHDLPSSAFHNEEEKPSSLKIQMTERIKQLQEERDSYTRKLLELGKVYKRLKDNSLIKDRLLEQLRFLMTNQLNKLSQQAYELRLDTRKQIGMILDFSIRMVQECALQVQERTKEKYSHAFQRQKLLRQECFYELLQSSGNVRVFCRIKPTESEESNEVVRQSPLAQNEVEVFNSSRQGIQKWKFDMVIEPDKENAQLNEASQPFARALLDGYNGCILAYGQTCAGKTYSMLGQHGLSGIFQHIVHLLLSQNVKLRLSVCEIYLDRIFDLLPEPNSPSKIEVGPESHSPSSAEKKGEKISKLFIENQTHGLHIIQQALKLREMGANNVHEHSSRSHLIITLYLRDQSLALVDLAGSQRLPSLKTTPLDLKRETVFINKSLLALRQVIHAKATKAKHVGYRNSVLTSFLRDTLERDAKLLFVAHLDPNNVQESVNTLNIAQEARGVVLKHK